MNGFQNIAGVKLNLGVRYTARNKCWFKLNMFLTGLYLNTKFKTN